VGRSARTSAVLPALPRNTASAPTNPNDFGWATSDSACNRGLYITPDPLGQKPGFTLKPVPAGGPNAGLWYVNNDITGSHPRAQLLKDIRPDGSKYSLSGSDSVGNSCKRAKVNGQANVTTVTITCVGNPRPLGFSDLYAFAWRHEQCHEFLAIQAFQSIPDARTVAETVVRPDSASERLEVNYHPNSFYMANDTIYKARRSRTCLSLE